MTSARLSLASILVLASCQGDPGATGPQGETGPQGGPGSQGNPGEPGATTGTIAGVVSDGVAGDPLSGVDVTAEDAGGGTLATATTDTNGHFSVTVPAGVVDLAFAKDRYTPPGLLASGVGIGETVQIAVTMNESASGRPSLLVAVTGDDFGYGATVPLTATATDPNGDTLTYTWSNATSPALGAVSGTGSSGTVALPAMTDAFAPRSIASNPNGGISGYVIENRFGVVPIIPDTRGQVTANVKVNDGRGQIASASLTINAASVTGNVKNVALGQRVYVNSGHDGTNAWTLTSASCDPARDIDCTPTIPCDTAAVLDDATSRTPSFVAGKLCLYTLAEGANTMTISAGTFSGAIASDGSVPNDGEPYAIDKACRMCHVDHVGGIQAPDMFTPWMGTKHATTFVAGIDGDLGEHFNSSCTGCHTTGTDYGLNDHGFDDVALANDWTFPLSLDAANWENLYTNPATGKVAAMANVQCESCHGPNNSDAHTKTQDANLVSQPFSSPRVSYGAESCGTCHAAGDDHIYSEWASFAEPFDGVAMSHGNRGTANLGAGATGLNTNCGRCHTAQGYTLYADLLERGTPVITMSCTVNGVKVSGQACDAKLPAASTLAQITGANAEPVACAACHDPHDATNPDQLRVFDTIAMTPAGFGVAGFGKGASCVSCHNSRNGTIATSDTFTFLHESTETKDAGAGAGNPPSYSAPHQADQADVFTGHNAYFMGFNMPMTSKHAAITDTCVGCHMTLNPASRISFGAPATNDHTFFIAEADQPKLCANCHGGAVNGAAIQAQVEAQLGALDAKLSAAFVAKVAALPDKKLNLLVHDQTTDTTSPLFTLDTAANPILSVAFIEVHGQVSLTFTLANPVTIPWGPATPAKTLSVFDVQLGSIKDNQPTPAVLYALSGNFIRAGWNYFLIEGDQSKGLHNPSYVTAVLNTTLNQDLTN